MNYIFDLVFALFIAVGFLVGWKKGFFAFFAKPLKFVGSVILAFLYGTPVSERFVVGRVEPVVTSKINAVLNQQDSDSVFAKVCNRITEKVAFPISAGDSDSEDLVAFLSNIVSNKISYFIAIIGLFILGFIVISLLVYVVGLCVKKGPIGFFDRFLGLALGGVLVFLLFLGGVRLLNSGVIGADWNLHTENSLIYPYLQQFNPLEFIQNTIRKIQE